MKKLIPAYFVITIYGSVNATAKDVLSPNWRKTRNELLKMNFRAMAASLDEQVEKMFASVGK